MMSCVKGSKLSDEHKAKLSKKAKGIPLNKRGHKKDCLCPICRNKRGDKSLIIKGAKKRSDKLKDVPMDKKGHKPNCKCCICRAKRHEPLTEERKNNISKAKKGKKLSLETRKKMSNSRKGRKIGGRQKGTPFTEEHKNNISKSLKGRVGVMKGKKFTLEHKEKIRQWHIEQWENQEFREKQMEAMLKGQGKFPNKPEKQLDKILQKLSPDEWQYTGNGSCIIGYKNPDFININGQKKLIELYGDYWHGEEVTGRTKEQEENKRIKYFRKYGYETLIIWEHELKNKKMINKKILEFIL